MRLSNKKEEAALNISLNIPIRIKILKKELASLKQAFPHATENYDKYIVISAVKVLLKEAELEAMQSAIKYFEGKLK